MFLYVQRYMAPLGGIGWGSGLPLHLSLLPDIIPMPLVVW